MGLTHALIIIASTQTQNLNNSLLKIETFYSLQMERKLHVYCANLLYYTVEEHLVCRITCDMYIKNTLDQAGYRNVSDMKKQSSLFQYVKSTMALGHGKCLAINRSIAVMCVVDMRPMSIVNGN